jgi:hypothetical protein
METKFTKGPWELADENDAHFEIQIGETICSLDRCSPHSDLKYVISRDEMIANGHLIMAAPDLLEAINLILPRLIKFETDEKIRTSIACKFQHAILPVTESDEDIVFALVAIKKATT